MLIIKQRLCMFISIYFEEFIKMSLLSENTLIKICEFLLQNIFHTAKKIAQYESFESLKIIFEEKKFINYFPIDSREHDYVIESCQYFIDHRYDKNFDTCGFYLMNLKKAIVEFENDFDNDYSTKGSLDRLEYAQSDIYDWVKENIELEGENYGQ